MRAAIWFWLMATLALPAQGAVLVSFVDPENYTDAGSFAGYGAQRSDPVLVEIERYLQALGERSLSADQTLRVEILDIDLAGRFEPWRSAANRVRILNTLTWPRFKLRYSFEQGGVVLREGEQTLSDLDYLSRTDASSQNDALRYEKALLKDWLLSIVGAPQRPGADG